MGQEGDPSPVPGLAGNKFPLSPGPRRNKFGPSLLLLPLLLLFFLLGFFISRRFFISNSFPGWLGKDFIKSLSVCFLFKSVSLISDPTIGFSALNVETSSEKRVLTFNNIFTYWVKFLSKSRIIYFVFCNVMVNVCLYSLREVRCCNNIFLNVLWRQICIVCYPTIKIRTQKIVNIIC